MTTSPAFTQAGVTSLAGTGTASVGAPLSAGGDTAYVTNLGTIAAWVSFGVGAATAVVGSGYVVLPTSQRVIGVGSLVNYAATILNSTGAGTVVIETGNGAAH